MLRNTIEPMHAIRREHQALAILRVLRRDQGRQANDRVLADYLQTIALGGSHEQVRDALQRLSELGLVVVESIEELAIARLTERGEAVAVGNDSCEGILHAYPECPY
ncbi:hypothetical protein NKH99_25420 [Mesorhizobium sp. M0854]|uniref:VpaChn25_0724 family phage protein n=1 Tax=Mesorhizobium sp. M0854 TaxID=2957013 RepID=UPI00333AF287